MAYGICYTQSGNVKKYEPGGLNRPDQVKWITGYTVGYPSTAYYPGILCDNFYLFTYGNNPDFGTQYPEFTEGTAIYFMYPTYIANNKIYDLMSYTPPNGYILSENGPYTYTAKATVYSCNEDVEYYNAINTVNIGTTTIRKEFKYKKKDSDSKVYVKLTVSNVIIINGNTYRPSVNKPIINTINLKSGYGRVTNILVSLDSNHYMGSFDISFDGAYRSNEKIYLLVNNQYYDVTNSIEGIRCNISSKYQNGFHVVGDMQATNGFVYNFNASDLVNNGLVNNGLLFLSTQEGIKDSSGRYIPGGVKAKFVVKFTLNDGYYHQDCQLIVDVTTNK